HCISEWGHDFRPEYLEIGGVLAELAASRVLACTATATPVVRDEILARLGLPPDTPQIVRGFARPNLSLRALEVSSGRERERAGLYRGLLSGSGTRGARRRRRPRAPPRERPRSAAAARAPRARRRGGRPRSHGRGAQVEPVPRADPLGGGRKLPSRRDPPLLR